MKVLPYTGASFLCAFVTAIPTAFRECKSERLRSFSFAAGFNRKAKGKMKVTEATSQKIKNMSLLCAAFVVSIHIGIPGELDSPLWLVHQLVVDGIARIAVPFFFVVSGFFLAAHFNETGWWGRELKKRLSSLVIPFFVWSLLFVISLMLGSIITDLLTHRPLGTGGAIECIITNWLKIPGVYLTKCPILGPLWYVRCLFFFVLAAPIISKCVTKFKYTWLIACFAALLVYTHLLNPTFQGFFNYGFSLSGLFYFSVGIFIQLAKPKALPTKLAIVFGIVGIALWIAKTICLASHDGSALGKLFVPFLLVATWHFMPAKRLPDWLTSCSFPIFLMHEFFFPYVHFAVKHLPAQYIPFVEPTINFIVGFFGSIAVTLLLRKHLPGTSRVLFGGR